MKRRWPLLSVACVALCFAAWWASRPTYVLASELYPALGPGDSSAIPGRGRPFEIWATNDYPAYGPPRSKILWAGIGWTAVFALAASAAVHGGGYLALRVGRYLYLRRSDKRT